MGWGHWVHGAPSQGYMHSDFGTGLSPKSLQHLGVRTPVFFFSAPYFGAQPEIWRTPGCALDVLLTVLSGMVSECDRGLSDVGFVRRVLALSYTLMWGGNSQAAWGQPKYEKSMQHTAHNAI